MSPDAAGADELTRQTREYYDSLIGDIGEEYLHERWGSNPTSASHYRHTKAVVSRILGDMGSVDRALEVGCGPGTWTDLCLGIGEKLTVFDVSEEMLKVVRSRFPQEEIEYVCGDFVELPESLHDTFDLVFSARALEYMSDKAVAVERVWAALRPGGHAVLITKNPGWRDKRRAERRDRAKGAASGDIQRDWVGWERLEELMRGRGFADIETVPVAFGSYEWPVSDRVGVWFSEAVRSLWGSRPMHPRLDWIVESYAVVGRKPVGAP